MGGGKRLSFVAAFRLGSIARACFRRTQATAPTKKETLRRLHQPDTGSRKTPRIRIFNNTQTAFLPPRQLSEKNTKTRYAPLASAKRGTSGAHAIRSAQKNSTQTAFLPPRQLSGKNTKTRRAPCIRKERDIRRARYTFSAIAKTKDSINVLMDNTFNRRSASARHFTCKVSAIFNRHNTAGRYHNSVR